MRWSVLSPLKEGRHLAHHLTESDIGNKMLLMIQSLFWKLETRLCYILH